MSPAIAKVKRPLYGGHHCFESEAVEAVPSSPDGVRGADEERSCETRGGMNASIRPSSVKLRFSF